MLARMAIEPTRSSILLIDVWKRVAQVNIVGSNPTYRFKLVGRCNMKPSELLKQRAEIVCAQGQEMLFLSRAVVSSQLIKLIRSNSFLFVLLKRRIFRIAKLKTTEVFILLDAQSLLTFIWQRRQVAQVGCPQNSYSLVQIQSLPYKGVVQLEEHQSPKLGVVGSSPTTLVGLFIFYK